MMIDNEYVEATLKAERVCNSDHEMTRMYCPDCGACATHIEDRCGSQCQYCGSSAEPIRQHRELNGGAWVDD